MIKNIIFDWSGVVNDSVENLLIVVNRMFAELHLNPISLLELKQEWEQPYMRFYNKYAPNLTLEEEQVIQELALGITLAEGEYFIGYMDGECLPANPDREINQRHQSMKEECLERIGPVDILYDLKR